MSWTPEKANETFEKFKLHAAEDKQFKALALENPEEAIKQLTDIELPEGIQLAVTEDDKGELAVKVAFSDATGERELDEAELDLVAGGIKFQSFIVYSDKPEERQFRRKN